MKHVFMGSFLFVCLLGTAVAASEGVATYVIRTTSVPPLKVGLTTGIAVRLDKSVAANDPTHIVFDVYEGVAANGAQWKWIYSFHNIGVGDEVALQGAIYRVSAIKYADVIAAGKVHPGLPSAPASLQPSAELSGGCGQHCGDFVSIVDTGDKISPAENDSIVLSNAPLSGVTFFHGTAEFQMKFNSLRRDLSGKYVADIEWRRGDQLQDVGVPARKYGIDWSPSWTRVTTHSGDFINLPEIGRLRVESILPSQSGRTDWVVVVTGNQ